MFGKFNYGLLGHLILEGCGVSIYIHIPSLYGLHQVHISYFEYMLESLIIYIVSCQGENKNMFILDIDDQNTPYVSGGALYIMFENHVRS